MKRIHLLFLAAVLVATFTVLNISSFRVAAQPPRPNIVVIMTDDQGIVPPRVTFPFTGTWHRSG